MRHRISGALEQMVRMKTMVASEMTKHHMSVENIIMKKKSAEKIIMK